MKRTLQLSLISLITCLSCRKDFVFPDPSLTSILGTWQWEQNSGGLAGITISRSSNPENAHTYEFRHDGIAIEKSRKSKLRFSYTIEKRSSIFSLNQTWQLQLTERGHSIGLTTLPASINFMSNGTLLLSYECNDCFTAMYKRKSD